MFGFDFLSNSFLHLLFRFRPNTTTMVGVLSVDLRVLVPNGRASANHIVLVYMSQMHSKLSCFVSITTQEPTPANDKVSLVNLVVTNSAR